MPSRSTRTRGAWDDKPPNDVKIAKIDDQWAVFVVENGKLAERRFHTEPFAKSFAEGQRLRLKLKSVAQEIPAALIEHNPEIDRRAEIDKFLLEDAIRRRSKLVRKPVRGRER
ncbi:hypothetical protein ABMA32_22270 [Mesorhizobium sp. VNQ89]|uniref:hypothetical protein n=1 Tax=Mesorhizobium quangtriensis TaxID=3157709 RepID=UPI0032B78F5E